MVYKNTLIQNELNAEFMPRPLQKNERELLLFMLNKQENSKKILNHITDYRVVDMSDGGMGSIRVVKRVNDAYFGSVIAEAKFLDEDGVVISVTVNANKKRDLYEIDIWKVNFEQVLKYPSKDSYIDVVK